MIIVWYYHIVTIENIVTLKLKVTKNGYLATILKNLSLPATKCNRSNFKYQI